MSEPPPAPFGPDQPTPAAKPESGSEGRNAETSADRTRLYVGMMLQGLSDLGFAALGVCVYMAGAIAANEAAPVLLLTDGALRIARGTVSPTLLAVSVLACSGAAALCAKLRVAEVGATAGAAAMLAFAYVGYGSSIAAGCFWVCCLLGNLARKDGDVLRNQLKSAGIGLIVAAVLLQQGLLQIDLITFVLASLLWPHALHLGATLLLLSFWAKGLFLRAPVHGQEDSEEKFP